MAAQKITYENGELRVPDQVALPFIEGDGTGPDIWRASVRVFDGAVAKAYGGRRGIEWVEVLAGEKSFNKTGEWLPKATLDSIQAHRVAIKGPLTTPVGGGIRSLNVALRQLLDLYACVRPVRYFKGVPAPVKNPERLDVVLYRENTEDVYSGVEFQSGTPEARKLVEFLDKELSKKVRPTSGLGIKPISPEGSKRLVRKGIQHAFDKQRKSVTLVHKGNIMKFTEGAFRDWGYELAKAEFRERIVTERETWILDNRDRNADLSTEKNAEMIEPGLEMAPKAFREKICEEVRDTLEKIGETHGGGRWKKMMLIKDRIADSMFQQLLLRPDEYDLVCTPNLNGDYLSDAMAAQVGGLGIAPGGNIGDGYAVFEATHGTAPKYAGKDQVNPGSVILSGVMMFEYLGWQEAADAILRGLERTIEQKRVTYDFHRALPGATLVKCSEFGNAIVENM